ncbi:MAG: arsenate reductase ArsC [Gemmatimonadales bacterium]
MLFLCTRNSARSQIAEALLTYKAERLRTDRYVAGSAGASPATAVHPRALAALRARGIEWGAASPKSIDAVAGTPWDLIITVCDRAKETCPVFPGKPIFAHWGMSDPAEATGDDAAIRRAFDTTLTYLSRRIDLLLALPFESLEQSAFELRVQQIARDVPAP